MTLLLIVQLFFFGFFSTLLFLGAGKLALGVRLNNKNSGLEGLFLLIGILIFVVLFAAFKTRGNTVFLIFIPILFLVAGRFRKKNREEISLKGSVFSVISTVLLSYCISFLFILFFVQNLSGKDWVGQPDQDYIFYMDVAQSLKTLGAENLKAQFNNINDYAGLREPYHYFELWLTAGLSSAWKMPVYFTFLVLTHTILLTTSVLLVFNLLKKMSVTGPWIFIAPLLLLIKPIFITHFLSGIENYTNSIIPNIKYQVIETFMLAFVLLWYHDMRLAVYFLLCIPLINIILLPSIFGIASFIITLQYFQQNKKDAYITIAGVLLIMLLFGFYYYLNSYFSSTQSLKPGNIGLFANFKTRVNIVLGGCLQLGFVFLPLFLFLAALMYFYRISFKALFTREIKLIGIMILAGIFDGLLAWAILFETSDAVQFFMNFSIAGLTVFIILVFIRIVQTTSERRLGFFKNAFLWLPFSLLIYTCITDNIFITPKNKISKDFADKLVHNLGSPLFTFEKNKEDYTSIFSVNDKYSWPCSALKTFKSEVSGISLSTQYALDIEWDSLTKKRIGISLKESPFINYLQKNNVNFSDIRAVSNQAKRFQMENNMPVLLTKDKIEDSSYLFIAYDPYSKFYCYKVNF